MLFKKTAEFLVPVRSYHAFLTGVFCVSEPKVEKMERVEEKTTWEKVSSIAASAENN